MPSTPQQPESTDIAEEHVVARLHCPPGNGPYPAVVVLGGSGGGLNWSDDVAIELARNGYAALALAYFGIHPLPKSLVNIELEFFEAALEWLKNQTRLDCNRLALVGGSRGGELALELGAAFSSIAALVCYAPSSVRWGPMGGVSTLGKSAWRWRGKPLPQMPWPPLPNLAIQVCKQSLSRVLKVPYRATPSFEKMLHNEDAVSRARIPVERIRGPILMISGTDDQLWPSTRMSNMVANTLEKNGHPFAVEQLIFEGAGHAIGLPGNPKESYPTQFRHSITGVTYALGGSLDANSKAAELAWREVLRFLESYIKN